MSEGFRRVLCLVADGFEEIETVAPVDLLRRAGLEVVVAAVGSETRVTGRSGIRMEADTRLDDVDPNSFTALLLPGGPMVAALRKDGRAARLATDFLNRSLPVAAICAAPVLLADAGLLNGRRFTAHRSVLDQLPGGVLEEPLVEDGLLITSRGAGTALAFAVALVRSWAGEAKAKAVGEAIHH